MKPENTLYYGDNLDIMRRYISDGSVDLVYLDPPFNSNADYNVLFAEKSGEKARAQIKAFEDTWEWDIEALQNFTDAVQNGGTHVAQAMMAFQTLIPKSDMLAYLSMMAPRLVELRRVLKPTGSIYLHCDPTASHYLKLLMDAVFAPENFRSEIIWRRTNSRSTQGKWPRLHDVLLQYVRTASAFFQPLQVPADLQKMPHTLITVDGEKYQTYELTAPGITKDGESGKSWRGFDPGSMGRHWANTCMLMDEWDRSGLIHWPKGGKAGGFPRRRAEEPFIAADRMVTVGDVWIDIDRINQSANERLGYPTQKPEALLERIISASSKEGNMVLDPFCGCGTAIAAAEKLKRKWTGIDITHLAIKLIKGRMADAFTNRIEKKYSVVGEPVDLESARALAQQDRHEFEYWALGFLHPQAQPKPENRKKGADHGVDGRLWIKDAAGEMRQIIIGVKSGNVGVEKVRELIGAMNRDKAVIGVFVTLEEPTSPMRKEATEAGFYQTKGIGTTKHPRVQILTIKEMFDGKRIDMPSQTEIPSFKQAPQVKRKGFKQPPLFE